MSFANFDNNSQLGAEINANLKLTKWWSTNASADVYYKTVRGTVTNINTNLPENKEINVMEDKPVPLTANGQVDHWAL